MRKTFKAFTEEREVTETCERLAAELRRLNVNVDGFVEWYLDEGEAEVREGLYDLGLAGLQGMKSWASKGASMGSKAGTAAGSMVGGSVGGLPGMALGTAGGYGAGHMLGGLAGGVAGFAKGLLGQLASPKSNASIEAQLPKEEIVQAAQKLKAIYKQHRHPNRQQVTGNLNKIIDYVTRLK